MKHCTSWLDVKPVSVSVVGRGLAVTLGLALIFALGAWLRLDQFADQVLTNDEWHPFNQAIFSEPGHFMLSFGFSDHSIPLTLMAWVESRTFGLSELAMRWPMLLAGLLVLVLFPLWAARGLGWPTALAFAFLLAISPILINYSRYARPYALTVLFSYVALYSFDRYLSRPTGAGRAAAGYVTAAALSVWLHPIIAPFVLAPFLVAVWTRQRAVWYRLLRLGLVTGLALAIVVLPPLLADPEALAGKSGLHRPEWATVVGVWHAWLGTPSPWVVGLCLVLASAGAPRVWQAGLLPKAAVTGLALTFLVLWVTRPSWLYHPLALARYLLPAAPLLLLAVAGGVVAVRDRLLMVAPSSVTWSAYLLLITPLYHTPLADTMRRPNGNTLHSVFQDDYRGPSFHDRYIVREVPLSDWWATLERESSDGRTIAVAPYQMYSPRWDAPRWELLSHHRAIPAFLAGFCTDAGPGEPPRGDHVALRNAAHLADPEDLAAKRVGWVVFLKPFPDVRGKGDMKIGEDKAHCLKAMHQRFGAPVHEDDKIVVFAYPPAFVAQPQ